MVWFDNNFFNLKQNEYNISLILFHRVITLVAPQMVVAEMPYIVFLRTNQLTEETNIAVKFRNENITKTIYRDGAAIFKLQFDRGGKKSSSSNSFHLKMIVNRENKCAKKTYTVETLIKKNYVFIQTDKPIYKPGDSVKIRIVVLNHLLKPALLSKATITVISPDDIFHSIDPNKEHFYDGYIESEYILDINTELGEWKIDVKIEDKVSSLKKFHVDSHKLPLYELYITAPSKMSLSDRKFEVKLEALYSFGKNVNGVAKICIKSTCIENNQLNPIFLKTFDIRKDFKIKQVPSSPTKFDLFVEFTGDLLTETIKKNVSIDVYYARECSIKIKRLPKIQGKLTYTLDAIVEDFDGNYFNETQIIFAHLHQNNANSSTTTTIQATFIYGWASFTFNNLIENNDKNIDIFMNDKCQLKNICLENEVLNNAIHVKHSPHQ